MILDEPGVPVIPPRAIRMGWIVTFSDLIALMLTFFVMLYSLSSRDPSKVDSTVSGLTEKFAKSAVTSKLGTVASQTGIVVLDQDYLDSVITAIRGRDSLGEVKLLRSEAGTLMVRLDRNLIFHPRTGVVSSEGLEIVRDIARAMLREDSSIVLPKLEIRVVGGPEEFTEDAAGVAGEAPVILRQAGSIARILLEAKAPAKSVSTVILEGAAPMLEIAFYATAAPESGAAGNGAPQ